MDFDLQQLRALSMAVSEGTLDAAARALHVTPSAVSQRLRALERAAGQVLLVRSKPVGVTPAGEAVLRLARQVDLLTADTAAELGEEGDAVTLPIAVNADSMGTWALEALATLPPGIAVRVYREDEGRTSELLRDGTVVAAITLDPEAVAGCRVVALGSMTYRAMATPDFIARNPDLATALVVNFDRNDLLQRRHLDAVGVDAEPPSHRIPASADYVDAIRLGLGWGMVADLQMTDADRSGGLALLDPAEPIDVELHLQHWQLRSRSLDLLAQAIEDGARSKLSTRRFASP